MGVQGWVCGNLIDFCDAGISVIAFHRHISDIPHATADLDGLEAHHTAHTSEATRPHMWTERETTVK